ncbi:MAG: SIMPL domain-containing protein [Planctomycetota bacterium]
MHRRARRLRGFPLLAGAILLGACMERPAMVNDVGETPAGADRLVTVIGHGRVAMPPESATFDAIVATTTPSPAEGWGEGGLLMGNVVRALESAGVSPHGMTLGEITLTQRGDGQWDLNQRLRVRTNDLGELPDLMGIASTAGARKVELHRFDIADPRAAGDRSRERALLDAEEKAEMLGRELLLRLVEVRAIEELPGDGAGVMTDDGLYETACALRVTYVLAP